MNSKIIVLLIALATSLSCMSQSSQKHASKGWNYLNKKEYSEAKREFQISLAKDTLPGNLSGMSNALQGLNELKEAKKYLLLLIEKFPKHRFTKVQIDLWNKTYPDNTINFITDEKALILPGVVNKKYR